MSQRHLDFKVDYGKLSIYQENGTENPLYPLVVSVPHAGQIFPAEFLDNVRLSAQDLRGNEDLYMDEIVRPLTKQGLCVISLNIARAFIDANRDKIELDPKMFYNYPQNKIAIENNRCRFGLGLIHRIDAGNNPIYDGLLSYNEVQQRIKNVYDVYHKRLSRLISKCCKKFGFCLVLDCHSMPSKICGIIPGSPHIDFCLGDLYSQSCPTKVTDFLRQKLENQGYNATTNVPYSGAFTTFNYCQPRKKIYTLQLEVNREIYAQEKNLTKSDNFQKVSADICASVLDLAKYLLDF